jgi:hypothetical protein
MEKLFLLGWKLQLHLSRDRSFPHCGASVRNGHYAFIDSLKKLESCG